MIQKQTEKRIWKYESNVNSVMLFRMPEGAEILSVQSQDDFTVCFWALCEPARPETIRALFAYGTGRPVSEDTGRYIGTVQLEKGKLAFHFFEREKSDG